MIIIRLLAVLLALSTAGAARAEWREASSRNFLVYSEGSEADLRDFAEKLEKFDFILRRVHNVTAPPSPNRLRVFLLANINAVGRMLGNSGAAGYYVDDARGLMMVGTRNSRNQPIDAESILLHEYAHHFMYQYFPATYPTWYSEGFAEFWGSTRFLPNNVVELGHPIPERLRAFRPHIGIGNMQRWLHAREMLSAQNYGDVGEVDLLYSLGWLLVRHTWEDAERRRQLQQYLALVNEGVPYADAATRAFGNLEQLNSQMFDLAGRMRWSVIALPFREFDIGPIAVRTPGPAEQALMNHEIRISQGVPASQFNAFADEVRAIAGRFPNDPYALRLLTEVERTGNNHAAAMAAADRLLAVAPNDPRGLMHKAMLQVDALRVAGSTDRAAWDGPRRQLARAIQLSPNDPLLYAAFYDSYVAQGGLPPEPAQAALYRAHELAPSDERLAYRLASDFEQRGMIREAIAIIRSDAYRVPARNAETERQRQRRERLEDRYRRAGERRTESARAMLDRLNGMLRQQGEAVPAATAAAPPRPGGNR